MAGLTGTGQRETWGGSSDTVPALEYPAKLFPRQSITNVVDEFDRLGKVR